MMRAKDDDRQGQHSAVIPLDFAMEARVAIARGIKQGDAVAELEYLGLAVRTINILEGSKFQITNLEELMSRRKQELLEIPNFGRHGLREVLECLAKYHELDDARRRTEQAQGDTGLY